MTQFWVRKAGSRGMLFGGKELKEKKSTVGEGFCIKCFISGAATVEGRRRPVGGARCPHTSGSLLPRSAARVRAGSQIPTNPDPSPVPASLSCSDHSLVQTPLSCFFISSIRLKHHLDYIFTEKSPMLPPAQKRPSFSLISHPWLRSALETDHLLP